MFCEAKILLADLQPVHGMVSASDAFEMYRNALDIVLKEVGCLIIVSAMIKRNLSYNHDNYYYVILSEPQHRRIVLVESCTCIGLF